jgi:glycosyltransferase involved in cell wall biosynthesis
VGSAKVRSYWPHGVGSRVAQWAGFRIDAAWNRAFGRWAARQVARAKWDLIHCWSGVYLELVREHGNSRGTTLLMRGSAHIRTQARILSEEQLRTGVAVEQPSAAMIEREQQEYAAADQIVVLSSFAHQSFIDEGVPAAKLRLLKLGVENSKFRPPVDVVRERRRRILSGSPLRVLYVGTLTLRKGMRDAAALVREAALGRFAFRFVGPVSADARAEVQVLRQSAEVIPKQPQGELAKQYAWADLFLFPTLEDGFSVVLKQAHASGLPILCTTNCGGPDFVREDETGWILPIRSPKSFLDRLEWCDRHRVQIADMAERVYLSHGARSWEDVAQNFEAIAQDVLLSPQVPVGGAAQ